MSVPLTLKCNVLFSRVQESKCLGVQSLNLQTPRIQVSKVQASRHPEPKYLDSSRTEPKRPDHVSRVQLFRYAEFFKNHKSQKYL